MNDTENRALDVQKMAENEKKLLNTFNHLRALEHRITSAPPGQSTVHDSQLAHGVRTQLEQLHIRVQSDRLRACDALLHEAADLALDIQDPASDTGGDDWRGLHRRIRSAQALASASFLTDRPLDAKILGGVR